MKKFLLATALCTLASSAQADRLLGVFIGASQWSQGYEGTIRDLNSNGMVGESIDLETDLGMDDEDGNVFYVAFEHSLPLLPSIRLQQTELEIDSTGTLQAPVDFGDATLNAEVQTDMDLSHSDATFYWQLLDNTVSFDLGLTARWFDGEVTIDEINGNTTSKVELDAVLPLIYLSSRFDLPLSGLYAGISGNFLGDGDNNFIDYQLTVGYEPGFGVGIEAGFRSLELDLEDVDDIEADITIDGGFISLFIHL